jgi:hypothetical protein
MTDLGHNYWELVIGFLWASHFEKKPLTFRRRVALLILLLNLSRVFRQQLRSTYRSFLANGVLKTN